MGGWLGGWGEIEIKANSAQLELELGLSLAIITKIVDTSFLSYANGQRTQSARSNYSIDHFIIPEMHTSSAVHLVYLFIETVILISYIAGQREKETHLEELMFSVGCFKTSIVR